MSWEKVDEGWGRRAADFATLLEPGAAREYVTVFRRLDLRPQDRLLDLACGSGLALELAGLTTPHRAGVDASARLAAVARRRNPGCDVVVGDMAATPFPDASFDVVTSFRGIWGTTPEALVEARRVLRPGGRVALTFWGEMASSPGGRLFGPFRLADDPALAHQGAMVALKHPGAAQRFLADAGFDPGPVERVPCVLEFADAEHYARALASTGPGYEAVQAVGEQAFHDACLAAAEPYVAEGLPIRGELELLGILGRVAPSDPARS